MNTIEGTRLWTLSEGGHYRRVVNIEGTRRWGTIGLWALSESWRTGARLAAVIEAVARLAAVIDWAWKAEIGLGKLELGLESWNLILQVHSSFCRTSQLELQFSIGIVYTI